MPDDISEDFRAKTVKKLNEDNADMIRRLTKLIGETNDPKIRSQAERELRKHQALAIKLPKR